MTRIFLLKKIPATLQIVAILLLQLYAFMPFISRMMQAEPPAKLCSGDHRICGCSPERVAVKTCCCYRSGTDGKADGSPDMPGHGGGHQAHDHSGVAAQEENDTKSAGCFLRSLPCGKQPAFIASFFQDLTFLNLAPLQLIPPSSCKTILSSQAETLKSNSVQPPVPPPENPFLA